MFTMSAVGVDETSGVVSVRINSNVSFVEVCFFKMIKGTRNHAIVAARTLLWIVNQHLLFQEVI
jgi:hypothetical protein